MTLPQLATDIINSAQGAVYTEGSKFAIPYIYDLIHQYREVILRTTYERTGRTNPLWLQQFFPEFVEATQESKLYVKFECPAPVILDDQTDGFFYIGTQDKACNFRKNQNRAELAMYQEHRVTKVSTEGKIKTIWSEGFLEVYGNPLQKAILVDGVFSNPTLLPEYSLEFSDYPLDLDSISQLKDLMAKAQTDKMAQSPTNSSASITDKPTTIV